MNAYTFVAVLLGLLIIDSMWANYLTYRMKSKKAPKRKDG